MPSVKSTSVPLRTLQFRPPGRWRASRIVHDHPALPSSYAATRPAMPPPRITTRVPLPSTSRSGPVSATASGNGQQPERLHEDEGGAVSARLAGSHQELASREAHLVYLSGDRGPGCIDIYGRTALRAKIRPDVAESEGCGGLTVEDANAVWPDFRPQPGGTAPFFLISSSLVARRHPVSVAPHS